MLRLKAKANECGNKRAETNNQQKKEASLIIHKN